MNKLRNNLSQEHVGAFILMSCEKNSILYFSDNSDIIEYLMKQKILIGWKM